MKNAGWTRAPLSALVFGVVEVADWRLNNGKKRIGGVKIDG
ncbi:hypothetical protein M6D81_13790 [Paenibacillus sp. J5C_2022]|nr:hypothetical protein [Paenibacillus sp. J5C2022]MCU6709766.1 hypothetical protein [Paenibacillus sp. J5C2022]